MELQIENRQTRIPIPLKTVRRTARDILNALDCPDGELSVLIVDDDQIAAYNRDWLNCEGATNVIAFPMQEGAFAEVTPTLLGDVVVSAETALREAETAGMTLEERFNQLLIHGILHLFGYDHVHDDAEARRMSVKSRELLAGIETRWPDTP